MAASTPKQRGLVIDLTQDASSVSEDEEVQVVQVEKVLPGGAQRVQQGNQDAGALGAAEEQDEELSSEEQDDEHLVFFGWLLTQVVGVRYYDGVVTTGESVLLEREPHNPYDHNAIVVNNVESAKIGHIGRDQAAVLAPMIDKKELRVEGMADGPKGAFKMPIMLSLYGPLECKAGVARRMAYAGMPLNEAPRQRGEGTGSPAGRARGPRQGAYAPPPAAMSKEDMEKSLERMFDELGATSEVQDMLRPGQELTTRLYPHQMVALAWMCKRENRDMLPPFWEPSSKPGAPLRYFNVMTRFMSNERPAPLRGGIVADDMGLGKTLTTIALIATNKPGVSAQELTPFRGSLVTGLPVAEAEAGQAGDAPAAPQQPAKRRKGAGGKASASQADAAGAGGSKRKQGAASAPDPAELAASLEGPPLLPARGGPAATLIVCPLSVLSNWQLQLEEHTAGNLKVYMHYGPQRSTSPDFIGSHDVVITSYATLASDYANSKRGGRGRAGPFGVHWLRVVLDEAHTIRNHKAKQSEAACALKADRRWALSGTPIQNSLKDIYGVVLFLGLQPLAEKRLFTTLLERPVRNGVVEAIKRLQVLMGHICIRRTKDMQVGGRPLVALPGKTVTMVKVDLTPEDRAKYNRIEEIGVQMCEGMLRDSTLLQNYALVLQLILRLRQVCNAGCLCPPNADAMLTAAAADAVKKQGKELGMKEVKALKDALLVALEAGDECPVCLGQLEQPVITAACAHVFCEACVRALLDRAAPQPVPCPLCRGTVEPLGLIGPLTERELALAAEAASAAAAVAAGGAAGAGGAGGAPKHSAKVKVLLDHLLVNHQINRDTAAARRRDPPLKAVVFSAFTQALDLVARGLDQHGVPFVRLDGSVSNKARREAIETFSSASPFSPSVFLIALKAGGVGLNLTAASQVFLLEPHWNSAAEEQAMDRVHRMGQVRDVTVIRLVATGTIEERILVLQERKRALSHAAFDRRSAQEARQMRTDDIKLLMRL